MPARSASGTASEKGCRSVCPDSTIRIRRSYRSKLKDSKEGANLTTLARHVGQLSAQVPPGRNRARNKDGGRHATERQDQWFHGKSHAARSVARALAGNALVGSAGRELGGAPHAGCTVGGPRDGRQWVDAR